MIEPVKGHTAERGSFSSKTKDLKYPEIYQQVLKATGRKIKEPGKDFLDLMIVNRNNDKISQFLKIKRLLKDGDGNNK